MELLIPLSARRLGGGLPRFQHAYRLYGLTPDEIKLVEEAHGHKPFLAVIERVSPVQRLWACDARMFVSAGGVMVAGTEALVVEDGGCTVARASFVSLFRIYGHKKNTTIEAKPGFLQIEDERIRASDYSDLVTAAGDFKVFPVTASGVVAPGGPGTRRL